MTQGTLVETSSGSKPLQPPAAAAAMGWRGQPWPWALLTLAGLIYWVWAGSSYDPRKMSLWWFRRDGWISLVPGLGHLLLASALVLGGLSMVAWRAAASEVKSRLWHVVVVGLIVVLALDVRLAVLRNWLPMVLDAGAAGARVYRPVAGGRGLAILADMVTLGIVLLALGARRRNFWWAALFALHPVAIIESAANGSGVSLALPLVALVALGWRLQRWARELAIMTAAALCTWWLAHLALAGGGETRPFDGLLAQSLAALGMQGRNGALGLVGIGLLLQGAVVLVALRRGWDLARTLGHILVIWAVTSPRVMPSDVLPIIVLAALGGWTRAGWVLSGTVMGAYLMLGLFERGAGAGAWAAPLWLVMLMLVPVVVFEGEELACG